jgi:hypothetical protein
MRMMRILGWVVAALGSATAGYGAYGKLLFAVCDSGICSGGPVWANALAFGGVAVTLIGGLTTGGRGLLLLGPALAAGALLAGLQRPAGDRSTVLVYAAVLAAMSLLALVGVAIGDRLDRRARQLVAEGGQAIGTVIELRDTGESVNDNPRVRLHLRIEPVDGSPAFERQKTITAPRLSPPYLGRHYPVWYDRSNPGRFAVGTQLSPTATDEVRRLHALAEQRDPGSRTADPLDRLAKLNQLWRDGALTDAEFEAFKARILADELPG